MTGPKAVVPRRTLLIGACLAPMAWAQSSRQVMKRVGVLAPSTAAKEEVTLKPFFDRMRQIGWIEGQTVLYERAYADDRHDRLPALAAGLVQQSPHVIYAPPVTAAVAAAKATRSVPVVFASVTDPVGAGLVESLGRPGGNVTGISNYGATIAPKRLELLREILPKVRRIGIIGDAADPTSQADVAALTPIVKSQGLSLHPVYPRNEEELAGALDALAAQRIEALMTTSSLTYNLRDPILARAVRERWPVFGHRPPMAEAGAVAAYASSLAEQLRRSADLVDRVLKGRKPSEIPIEQPTVFEFVLNAQSAKTLRIEIPRLILMRADRVIG